MSAKVKYPRMAALSVAKELCDLLKPVTQRLIVAGSLRRRKEEVGDVEIVFIPKWEHRQVGLFAEESELTDLAGQCLDNLINGGLIQPRKNVNGSTMWGAKNKLALHVASGIPVDFFTATEVNWFNYLVCRTGGADNNTALASAAQAKGWKWNPYGPGFTDATGQIVPVNSEREVFELAGLPYREPWERL